MAPTIRIWAGKMKKAGAQHAATVVLVILLIVIAALLFQLSHHSDSLLVDRGANILRAFIHFGLFITWGLSIQRRILQKQARNYLLASAALIVFWLTVRTVKYFFIPGLPGVARYLWYIYYIPNLLIPVTGVFIALSLGKPEEYRLPQWAKLLYIPSLTLLALVLTNDFHHLAFSFPAGVAFIKIHNYHFVYWAVFIWEAVCALTTLVLLIKNSRAPRERRVLWLPLLPFLILILYAVMYALGAPIIKVVAPDMTAVFCLIIVAIFESCIRVGLIRSNTYYEELFHGADIAAQIVDKDHRVRLLSGGARSLSSEVIRRVELAPIELDQNTRLSSAPIVGGRVLWQEDISEMNRLLAELKKSGVGLAKENELLQAELALKKRQAAVEEKSRLYDQVTQATLSQLQTLERILIDKEKMFQEKLVWFSVLGAFIKRRSNLVILSQDDLFFSAKELEYCFRESAEAVSEAEIACFFERRCQGQIGTEQGLLVYDLFQEILETTLPTLTALLINLHIRKGSLQLKLQLNCQADSIIAGLRLPPRLIRLGGAIAETREDGALQLTLSLPPRGDQS